MNPLLIGPLVTGAIAGLLALVIALTDRVVNDYGEVVLDINDGKKSFKVKGGSPLLGTLAPRASSCPPPAAAAAPAAPARCGSCPTSVRSCRRRRPT